MAEVILFPGGLPEGVPSWIPRDGPESCSGFPPGEKNIRIRPRGYFFLLRSILILPDLEIPLKVKNKEKMDLVEIYF